LAREPSKRATQPALIVLATILASVPILATAQFNSHERVDEFDAWLFAYYGREIVNGRTLYTELWDNKPPGIFWLNALGIGLSGGGLVGIRVLCALAVCGAAALVFAVAKRLYGWSAAGIATVLASLYLNIWLYHVGCNRPNTFFVPMELACFALYCAALTGARRPRAALVAAGLCGGAGLFLKQTALAASAAVLLHTIYLLGRRRLPLREGVSRLACFGAGWLMIVASAAVAILATSDAERAWYAVVDFNRLYFTSGAGSSFIPEFFGLRDHQRVMALPAILAIATLVQPLLRRVVGGLPDKDDDAVGKRPSGLLLLLWAWMVCALYLALVGPHRRLPYFGVALPPLVMLSAHGVYLLLRSGRRITQSQPTYHVIVGVLWFGFMMYFPLRAQIREAAKQYYHLYIEETDTYYATLTEAVRRHTHPDESLFVFGYGPKLYWDVDRPSAIPFIGTEKAGQLGAHGQPLFNEITALLAEAKPRVILVKLGNWKRSPSLRELDTSEVRAWIEANYDQPSPLHLKELWVRRD